MNEIGLPKCGQFLTNNGDKINYCYGHQREDWMVEREVNGYFITKEEARVVLTALNDGVVYDGKEVIKFLKKAIRIMTGEKD